MKILADESVESPVIARLRQEGHDVISIAAENPGITDEMVLQCAQEASAILLTADKDFGTLVYQMSRSSHGVGLYRLRKSATTEKAEIITGSVS